MNLEKRVRAIVEEMREAGLRLTTIMLFEPTETARRASPTRVSDPWLPTIERWLQQFDFAARPLTLKAVLTEALGLEHPSRADETRAGNVLRELGFNKVEDKKMAERYHYRRDDQQRAL